MKENLNGRTISITYGAEKKNKLTLNKHQTFDI